MGYARQNSTMKRLQRQVLTDLDAQRVKNATQLKNLWKDCRASLMMTISAAYRLAAAEGQWSSTKYARVRGRLSQNLRAILQQFHAASVPMVKRAVNELRDQSILRHAWALDQVTPASFKVVLPSKDMRESEILQYPGAFEDRWSSWLEAYNSALQHNLTLNSINEGSLTDAMDEVDATKANTPGYTLIDALSRISDYEAMAAISEGEKQIGALNEDAIEEEVWRTRGDLRVCDDCDANEGIPVDEIDYPPLHPNCHCYTEIVPASFAELLRSGDAVDNALAADMERDGVVPNALVIRGADGQIAAKTIISFDQWSADHPYAVMGQ